MQDAPVVIKPVGEDNLEATLQVMAGWVSADQAEARQHLAAHSGQDGASLAASRGPRG
jgi:hypothetical protein